MARLWQLWIRLTVHPSALSEVVRLRGHSACHEPASPCWTWYSLPTPAVLLDERLWELECAGASYYCELLTVLSTINSPSLSLLPPLALQIPQSS